jgi:hypothetical protein
VAVTQLWGDQAGTTLASAITSIATSLTVVNGNPFPVPAAGQGFQLTLTSATNSAFQEVVTCTTRSGTTLGGLLRGQEGTTAQAFNAGDLAQNLITAGALQSLANINGSTSQVFNVSPAVASTQAVALSQLSAYLPVNNPAATGNMTVVGNFNAGGNIASQGNLGSVGSLTVNNGAAITGSVSATNNITAGNNVAAGRFLTAGFGATGSGNPHAATVLADFASSNTTGGWTKLPNGLLLQWGTFTAILGSGATLFPYTIPFPTIGLSVIATIGAFGPQIGCCVGAQPSTSPSQFVLAIASSIDVGSPIGIWWFAVGF